MPGRKTKSQARLTFEPVGAATSSPPAQSSSFSPAKVRFSAGKRAASSPSKPQPPQSTSSSTRRNKPRQIRLDQAIATPPPSSFSTKAQTKRTARTAANADSSDTSADEVGDGGYDENEVDALPPTQKVVASKYSADFDDESDEEPVTRMMPRSSQSVSTRLRRTVLDDDDDEEDEEEQESYERPAPRSTPPMRGESSITAIPISDSDDDAPILPSGRKMPQRMVELDSDSDEVVSPTNKRKHATISSSPALPTRNRTLGRLKKPGGSSPIKKRPHRGHRTEKEKKMELLRRRRAGEKIDALTDSESSSDQGEKKGLYDSDPEDKLKMLSTFDDEEEDEQPAPKRSESKTKKRKTKKSDEEGSDLDDFITDDDEDAPLGAPVDMPLEFTAQAHKPLKEQFPHVIEWLVHNKINPRFQSEDPVYVNAWRKLNDEFEGLANSKFVSAAWVPEFVRVLRSRPILESFELGDIGDGRYETCEACGRSGHPSTYKIQFRGNAYRKDTLLDVKDDDDGEDDDDEEGDDDEDDDDTSDDEDDEASEVSKNADGMPLPPTSKSWLVGVVCNSNAETAHKLQHWKYALKTWVEDRLEHDGHMTAEKIVKRENKMSVKKRRIAANKIVDEWEANGTITSLYRDFKKLLEEGRNKSTTSRGIKRGRFN
ncbi:hypothetical protein F5Y16DRAFT_376365 [Xylariaceae sp. FL0255]|nr:hypothetical protein F5Y16DRAFT_376365 [Xylariaceae sp. FL0255]